ncbi:MAG TPA: FAD-dependent monooxygenase [Vicinamibacterales bacterium]
MTAIDVIGGGPAGAMAAIAARGEGADVRVFEKATFPRHKVCGEFLSPEILGLLRRAGCAEAFLALRPAAIRHMELHFGPRVVRHPLPRAAYGLSRHALDRLLLDRATTLGAQVVRDTQTPRAARRPLIQATGRTGQAQPGTRLFGFKTHYRGVVDDTVALYFFDGCYVGVSAVEGGEINVCGLGPERLLRDCAFEPERLLARCHALHSRVQGFERAFDWLTTGPLVMGLSPREGEEPRVYPAGDALGFIDPFTGSGILNAMLSGHDAGVAAAQGRPVDAYLAGARRALRRPFVVSTVFRRVLGSGWAGPVASLVPGRWLFHWTRPVVPAHDLD